ncbi:MAG TPA: DUF11 domain-containing protein [Polyangia bacterium]|nr:DUF11 domain-containing protein [Polyangia bacterium]
MKFLGVVGGLALTVAFSGQAAAQQTFPSGSLIVPMDIDNQDTGMLRAFGLVYRLLLNDVPVAWCIQPGKSLYTGATKNPTTAANAVDFSAAAKDVRTGATVGTIAYRGGPFVIDAAYKTKALTVVTSFNTGQTTIVNVHEATASFNAVVSRTLVNAPNIGINADGNEAIAYGYLNAAGIPDSAGKTWSGTSADVMTPDEVAGPSTTDHRDGSLWGPTRLPHYCQLMSMHWSVSRDATSNEAIAEMSEYLLNFPVHLFAECQAVNQLEDAAAGHFVTIDNGTGTPTKSVACDTNTVPNNGLCAKKPTPVLPLEFLNSDLPFAQLDGPFKTVGGSEPAYGLAPGSTYYDQGIVMIRELNAAGGANGKSDLWMTGFANFTGGVCTISESGVNCRSRGKVSYLGGHQYSIKTPVSTNGDSQGTRLFLNSLFEAECVTAQGAANVVVTASAPAFTSTPIVTFTLAWTNSGAGAAVNAQLTDTLPAGVAFVAATDAGAFSAGKVVWNLGDIAPGASGSVTVTVSLPSYGNYANGGTVTYKVGNNTKTGASNTTTTVYGAEPPDAGTDSGTQPDGGAGLCANVTCPGPTPANPCKVGACDPMTGNCNIVNAATGTPCDDGNVCTVGTTCSAGVCGGGAAMQCAQPANQCQTAACVVGSGCVVSNLVNGAACSTGNKCVIGESCLSGTCSGGATRGCFASTSPCEVPICNPATGCGYMPGNDGASCDDGDVCTSGTTCGSGLCQGGASCPVTGICRVAACGTNGCEAATFAAAGTDPRGDCPAIGNCTRSCDGAGSCTTCSSTGGTGGGTGGTGGAGGAAGGTGGGALGGIGGGGGTAGDVGAGAGGSGGGATGGSGTTGAAGTGGTVIAGTGGGEPVSGAAGSRGGSTGTGGSSVGTAGGSGGVGTGTGGSGGSNGQTSASSGGCSCDVGSAPLGAMPAGTIFATLLAFGLATMRRRKRVADGHERAGW